MSSSRIFTVYVRCLRPKLEKELLHVVVDVQIWSRRAAREAEKIEAQFPVSGPVLAD